MLNCHNGAYYLNIGLLTQLTPPLLHIFRSGMVYALFVGEN